MVHTALLIIDMQKAFNRPIWGERNNPQAEQQALRVLAYFRKHALPVLHVQHISDNPQSQFHNKQNQVFKSGFEPITSEPVFQKTVNSAFIGTNLETYLYFFAELLNLFKNSTGPHMRSCFLYFYAFNCKSSSISARVLACEMAPRSLAAPEVPRR